MWMLSKQEHTHKGNFSKEGVWAQGSLEEYLCILHLENAWLQMSPLVVFIHFHLLNGWWRLI